MKTARTSALELAAFLPCCVCRASLGLDSGRKVEIMAWVVEGRMPNPLSESRYLGIAAPLCQGCRRVIRSPAELRARTRLGELLADGRVAWWESDEREFRAHLPAERN